MSKYIFFYSIAAYEERSTVYFAELWTLDFFKFFLVEFHPFFYFFMSVQADRFESFQKKMSFFF